METFLGVGLGNAVLATVLALGAAAVGRWCGRPALVRGLWLIVLLKLLTPPMCRVNIAAPLPERPARTGSAGGLGSEIATADVPGGEEPDWRRASGDAEPGEPVVSIPSQPSADVPEPAASKPSVSASQVSLPTVAGGLPTRWPEWMAVLVWAGGSVVCAVMIVVRVIRFGRLLRYADPAPRTVQRLAAVLGRRIGLAQVPRVWFVPGSVCPMLWAVGRPRVLVPRGLWGRLTVRQRSALLAHELAHLRRGDHWVRVLELLVAVAYWWFPVAWWARRRLREAEEQCCDAWVVWALPGSGRAYAGAILEAVEFVSLGPRVPVLASGMGQFASLKRRLTMIRSESVPRALSWYGRVGVAAVAGVLLPLAPSWAQSAADAPPGANESSSPVPAVTPASAAARVSVSVRPDVTVTDERAVIADLAVRSDDGADADAKDKDKVQEEKEKARQEKDNAKEEKARIKANKDGKAKIDADQKEREADDDDLAEARAEVRELSKQLEKAAQRLAKLEAKRHAGHAEGRAGRVVTPDMPSLPPVPPTPVKPGVPQPYAAKPVPPQPPSAFGRGNKWPDMAAMERAREQRLQAIEQRLRALMKEVDAIRRERDAQPGATQQPQDNRK
jgi:beta-lactamase regulating signal transducer with metallopeptidase domain